MNLNNDLNVLKNIWKKTPGTLICPQCHGSLTVIQLEQLYDPHADFPTYKTIIECSKCSFKLNTQSSILLGSVKNFTDHDVEIGYWSSSGSRVSTIFEHALGENLLQNLKKTGDLVEFLIVNNHVIHIIG